MEHRPDATEIHADPGTASFANFSTTGIKQSLDIPPRDRGVDWVAKNIRKGRSMPSGQRHIVSSFDIMSTQNVATAIYNPG